MKGASTVVAELKWAMYGLLTIDTVHIWAGPFPQPGEAVCFL